MDIVLMRSTNNGADVDTTVTVSSYIVRGNLHVATKAAHRTLTRLCVGAKKSE